MQPYELVWHGMLYRKHTQMCTLSHTFNQQNILINNVQVRLTLSLVCSGYGHFKLSPIRDVCWGKTERKSERARSQNTLRIYMRHNTISSNSLIEFNEIAKIIIIRYTNENRSKRNQIHREKKKQRAHRHARCLSNRSRYLWMKIFLWRTLPSSYIGQWNRENISIPISF